MDEPATREQIRREVHEGVEHLVVPVVMIVEGVLNDALVPVSEFGRHVDSWNGIPIPVLHPQERGEYVSANRPDIVDKNTIGRIYNAWVDGQKLKAEAWINLEKSNRLGYGHLVEALAAGEVVEISTGYFADDEPRADDYNGAGYSVIHRNIKPDHLALLPGEVGACSVADGCGTRVNQQKGLRMRVNEAFETVARALGLRSNCECQDGGGDAMSAQERAEKITALKQHLTTNKVDQKVISKITANERLTVEQMEMLMNMDAEQLKMASALAEVLSEGGGAEEPEQIPDPEGMELDDREGMAVNKGKITLNAADFDKAVANRVQEHLRRDKVIEKLKANEANPFDDKDMAAMAVDHLEKVERSLRPADYSGAGGFATNSDAIDTNVTPLRASGVLGRIKKQGE